MRKLKTFGLFFLFVVALLVAGVLQAQNNPYMACGARPGILENLFSNASKIREKCVEDIYEANKKKTAKEIEELSVTSDKLGAELKKVAIKVNFNIVQCVPRPGEPARDAKLIKRCEDLVTAQNAVISRMDDLSGWSDRPRKKSSDDNKSVQASITPPCPTKEKLQDLQVVRAYNKKLNEMWERCVIEMNEN
ncbi:MAG: hypothetical protein H7336_07700 [Bacteriovorax sp.]|nr:hypothetical protein [Bacteriovorax sp.]